MDGVANLRHLGVRQLREDRQAQHLRCGALGPGQAARSRRDAASIGGLQMHRHRVVDGRGDAEVAQPALQAVAVGRADHILVEDVRAARPPARQDEAEAGEPGVVGVGDGAAARIVGVEMAQFDAQQGRLHLVQPAVDAGKIADQALAPAILPSGRDTLRQLGIVGRDDATVAEGAQVLGRIEAVGGDVAVATDQPATDRRTVRLGAVLDHLDAMAVGDGTDPLHVRWLAV